MQTHAGDIRSFAEDFGGLALDDAWQIVEGGWSLDVSNGKIDSTGTGEDMLGRMVYHGDGVVKYRYKLNAGSDEPVIAYLRGDMSGEGLIVAFGPDFAMLGEALEVGSGLFDYQGSVGSTLGTWYEVTVTMDGDDIAVYRAKAGGVPVRVLHGRATTLFAGPVMAIIANDGCYASVDDFSFETVESEQYVARFNDANEMVWSADNDGRTAYTYDAWGRTTSKSRAVDASTTYTANYGYRFGQRLKWITTNFPGEQSADYNYDGSGKRRYKLVNGEATWFRWDAGYNMIAEYDAGADQTDWDPGNLEMSYIPGLAQVPGTNPATGAYSYFLTDHLGTVRSMLDQSKALTAAMEYSPYGEPVAWRGNVPATTYTGHYHDGESGMYFAPYRYYMPDAGRWLTQDPLGMVDGPNVYGYVMGTPTASRDILGLSRWPWGSGKLCNANCDNKCENEDILVLPEDDWSNFEDFPEKGTCVDADGVYSRHGRLKIPDGYKCTFHCGGGQRRLVCDEKNWLLPQLGQVPRAPIPQDEFPDNPNGPNDGPPPIG